MEKRAHKNALDSRQLELQAKMSSLDYINHKISDAQYLHGAAAAKQVADQYRDKLEQREAWREEFNQNEETLATLREELAAEEAAAAERAPEILPEPEENQE